MKLGLLSSILPFLEFDEILDFASGVGFECVEAACWPAGKAVRRYAGVSHIDVDELDKGRIKAIKKQCVEKKVALSSLAYYPNLLDSNPQAGKLAAEHLKKLILASEQLGIGMVTTFIGRDQNKTVEENLEQVREIWPPILRLAEEHHVRIAIENCPMLFGGDQWPGGQNLMTSPKMWRRIFEILPSDMLGLNFDPSHFVWQMMDYIKPVYEFRDKIFHVHIKDLKLYRDKLDEVGTMAYPLEYMAPKIPGLGDIDWGRFISALMDIGYEGAACVEIEDRAFENSQEDIKRSVLQSYEYIRQYVR